MGWQFEGRCFVTGERVEEAMPRMGDFQEVISPSLGRYRFSNSVAERFNDLTAEERRTAFDRAKAAAENGEIPKITTYHLDKP